MDSKPNDPPCRLPFEIQVTALRFALVQPKKAIYLSKYFRHSNKNGVHLLRVSKAWKDVGLGLFYGKNTFEITRRALPKPVFDDLQSTTISTIRHLSITTIVLNKTRVKEFKRCTGLRTLLIRGIPSPFTFQNPVPANDTEGITRSENVLRQALSPPTTDYQRIQLLNPDIFMLCQVKVELWYYKLTSVPLKVMPTGELVVCCTLNPCAFTY